MPNGLAYLMLLLWPVITLAMFRRMPIERALIWSILGGYLILPPVANFDLPLIPDLDKFSIANLSAYAACTLMLGHKVPLIPGSRLGKLLLLLFVLSPFATVMNNAEPIIFVQSELPGMRFYDSFAAVANQMIALLPLFLARRFLASPEAIREILYALLIGALIYSLPMLLEIRLSPQLNIWIYGFFQHSFEQMIRYGGYRPIVFLPHALWLTIFVLSAIMAGFALMRHSPAEKRPAYLVFSVYMLGVLVLCKTAGPLIYAMAMLPAVLLLGTRMQFRVAAILGLLVMVYPILRGAGVIPLDQILEWAGSIDPERAHSLGFRFGNEEELLVRAAEKPLLGWGGYGRNLIRDTITGEIETIVDGSWVIILGVYGWLGYIAAFGLLTLPLILMGRESLGSQSRSLSPYAAAIALILGVNMVDMLPNAPLVPLTWLMTGALLGYAESIARQRVEARRARLRASLPPRPGTIL